MKILARGSKNRIKELKEKLENVSCEFFSVDDSDLLSANLRDFDIIFDLKFDDKLDQLKYYANLKGITVFICVVKQSLSKAINDYGKTIECNLIGINALPTFINRSLAELSTANTSQLSLVQAVMEKFKWQYKLVEDRVGMVTPRIIFMIINEACYTVQEGTASISDVDVSMKLGTNYPFGPFEWANMIGIKHVYETLEALYQDTHDDRYKICPLLKTKYLRGETF